MITKTQANKLRALRASDSAVLSVYLSIPVDLAEHRGLATRAREMAKAAARTPASVRERDVESTAQAVTARSHDWLGHTIAIFACAELGLFEALPLPGYLTERAVAAPRPYTRPLFAAMQRNPAYRVALIDARHAWILAIADGQIETVAERTGAGVASPGFAGWYGLEAYRTQQRIIQLSRQHYRDTIAILSRAADDGRIPLVLGGHENEINQFLAVMPRGVRKDVAGSFNVDMQTVSPARARELAAPVIARWTALSETQLVNDVLSEQPDTSVTTNLAGCVAAIRSRAVAELVLADDQMVPGFACENCGALGTEAGSCDCLDPEQACRAVPDLLDELASRALDGGGQVTSVRNPPFTAAARLRFPVAAQARR